MASIDVILVSKDGLKSDILRINYAHLHSGYVTAIPPKLDVLVQFPKDTSLHLERRLYLYEGRRDRDKEIFFLEEQ